MPRPRHNTTFLPRQIREELGLVDHYGVRKQKQNRQQSRKERRKAERRGEKGTVKFRSSAASRRVNDNDDFSEDSGSEANSDREDHTKSKTEMQRPVPKSILKKTNPPLEDKDPSLSRPREISRGVTDKLANDDAEVAALERKLGIKSKKKLPKAFHDEGLADILGEDRSESEDEGRKRRREEDEWLQRKRRKALGSASNEVEENKDEDSEKEDGIFSHDQSKNGSDADEFNGFGPEDGETEKGRPKSPPRITKENPYVAPVTTRYSSRPKYIPPSLRTQSCEETESQVRLRRQARGLLNKLSESNLISILSEVEKLYREYPRQSVTSTLSSLLLGLVCDRSSLQDSFIILHAGFIAAIYKIIGMDFGADIIQKLVEAFDQSGDGQGAFEGKESINLMSLLSQLYNFHVIGNTLIFDYIRLFLSEISEVNTEFLLKIIKNSGPQLRQDDPSALKDIVLLIQPSMAKTGEAALSVRTKFMIDTITDLKNNRLKAGIVASSLASEHITKMRKTLGSLNSRNIRAAEPIRVSRTDIHDASKKGKWWLVGASWKDDPSCQDFSHLHSTSSPVEGNEDEPDILNIAKAHRMNTDVRRSIFVAIMSASDFRDAHVRLLKLRLKRAQEYEISRVLVHCSMQEEAHNPFYTLIARRLCGEMGRRIKMSFMFTLWDIFKRLGERNHLEEDDDAPNDEDGAGIDVLTTKSIVNLAKMYGSLVAGSSLSLAILKNLDFAYLQPKTSIFVELLIVTIIQQTRAQFMRRQRRQLKRDEAGENTIGSGDGATANNGHGETALKNVFLQTRDTPEMVRGLLYFVRKVVAKTDIVGPERDCNAVKWGCKVAVHALKAVSDTEPIMFD
ncbi:hypothetical protein V8E54_010441 [Elaphomyces granulatus]